MRLSRTIGFLLLLVLHAAQAATEYNIVLIIPGMKSEDIQVIQEGLSLQRYKTSPFVTESYFVNLQNKGLEEIGTALQTFGYYKPTINLSRSQEAGVWTVRYDVTTGPSLHVDKIDLQLSGAGSTDGPINEWKTRYPLHPGDIFTHAIYEASKDELLRLLRTRGYFNSRIDVHQVQVSIKENKADIIIKVDTGERHTFGEITVTSDLYDADYLQQFIDVKPGEPFLWQRIIDTQQRFSKSNEFLSIEIQPQLDAIVNLAVPVVIRLTPRKRWRYGFGLGYGTDVGAKVSTNVLRRRVTPTAHQAEFNAMVAEFKQETEFSYRIPLSKPESDFLTFAYAYNNETTDSATSENNTLKTSVSKGLGAWRHSETLNFSQERYTAGSDQGESQELVPGISLLYETPRTLPDTQQTNLRFYVELRGASSHVASDVGFTQGIMAVNLKYPATQSDTLVTRFKLGVSQISEFNVLPVSYRFYAGGDYSVRGYAYNSLGPTDEKGDVVGGSNLAVGSVEFQHQFAPQWDVAAFYDIGNAFDSSDFEFKKGAGVGIGKLFSFMSIRAYAANALSKDSRPWRFHLLIGAEL